MKITRKDFLVGSATSLAMLHVLQAEAKQSILLQARAGLAQLLSERYPQTPIWGLNREGA